MFKYFLILSIIYSLSSFAATNTSEIMEGISINQDRSGFMLQTSGKKFIPWGFNYDRDANFQLLEDYWYTEWQRVVEDFQEMKTMNANVVRIHLQYNQFMLSADKPNQTALKQLSRLISLAEQTGIYLLITGLGSYHKQDVPAWYDALDETARWETQALFWEAVAGTAKTSPAIFAYDLMNEPMLPLKRLPSQQTLQATEWLGPAYAGKHYTQRLALDLKGRKKSDIAEAWIKKMVAAIRKEDTQHMITLGIIAWPNPKYIFARDTVLRHLDFVSIHLYPKSITIDRDIETLMLYDKQKPLVISETFVHTSTQEEFNRFMQASKKVADGWLGFYWGKTLQEHREQPNERSPLTIRWLDYFIKHNPNQ